MSLEQGKMETEATEPRTQGTQASCRGWQSWSLFMAGMGPGGWAPGGAHQPRPAVLIQK